METVTFYDVHNPNTWTQVIKRRDIEEPDLVIRGGKTKETRMCRDLRKMLNDGTLQIVSEQVESTSPIYDENEMAELNPSFDDPETEPETEVAPEPPKVDVPNKRKAGRPKGSKNKAKNG